MYPFIVSEQNNSKLISKIVTIQAFLNIKDLLGPSLIQLLKSNQNKQIKRK